ncbi:hypothetical protein FraQA3DRAFT_4159 [Frankia sp. QA3]|nr:hypothetical protein FraQA3DRAFT_4159 [Frankia sp. QA3]
MIAAVAGPDTLRREQPERDESHHTGAGDDPGPAAIGDPCPLGPSAYQTENSCDQYQPGDCQAEVHHGNPRGAVAYQARGDPSLFVARELQRDSAIIPPVTDITD